MQRAASQNHVPATFWLGTSYLDGWGVTQDSERAEQLIRRAAESGYSNAQATLGWMYRYGAGLPIDYTEAVSWMRRSAEQGDPEGQTNLGNMYKTGLGVALDDSEAIRWYSLAADQGFLVAQINVASMLYRGTGAPRDPLRAHAWYDVILEKIGPAAPCAAMLVKRRDEVARSLSDEDTQRARQVAARNTADGLDAPGPCPFKSVPPAREPTPLAPRSHTLTPSPEHSLRGAADEPSHRTTERACRPGATAPSPVV